MRSDAANATGTANEESSIKRVRVIITQLLSKDTSNLDFEFNKLEGYLLQNNNNLEIIFEAAFPVKVIADIRILYTHKEAVENPKHV